MGTMENIDYVAKIQRGIDSGMASPWLPAVRLLSASIHICMTGTCGVALAYEQFLDSTMWPLKFVALFFMMVLHGTYNASASWGSIGGVGYFFVMGGFIIFQFLIWLYKLLVYIEPEFQRRRQLERNERQGQEL